MIDHLGNSYSSEQDMCEKYNISKSVFYLRYHKYDWPLEKALTTPIRRHNSKQVNRNMKKTIKNTNDRFYISSEYPSVEYVKYLRYKLSQEEDEQREKLIQNEINEIINESYWFSVMDMLYLKKIKTVRKTCPTEMIFSCNAQLKNPQGIVKKIYKNFAPRMTGMRYRRYAGAAR